MGNNESPRVWTEAQGLAIEAADHPILVSAAAGSGKTAVLCERILQRLLKGENIGDMLIVTFTRAAADQLRVKLIASLREAMTVYPEKRKLLRRQLLSLPTARISTIDSFDLDLMHTYFQTLGISAGVRVIDEQDNAALCGKLMSETVDAFCRSEDETLRRRAEELVDTIGDRDPEASFLQYRSYFSRYREGLEALRNAAEKLRREAEMPLGETETGKIIYTDAADRLRDYRRQMEKGAALCDPDDPTYGKYGKYYAYAVSYLDGLISAFANGGDAIREQLSLWNPPKPSVASDARTEAFNRIDEVRKKMAKDLKTPAGGVSPFASSIFLDLPAETLRENTLRLADLTDCLYTLLSRFEEKLWKEKQRLGVLDYTDMARLTLRLLQDPDGNPTPVAKELSSRYKQVCIDEYQDTSDLQDAVFSRIAPVNRFMVGDIKQSIYRFRGACPDLFEKYRREFTRRVGKEFYGKGGELIALSHNFRCDRSVIDFSNAVCGRLFGVSPSIGYLPEEDDLRMGKKPEKDKGLPVRLLLSDVSDPEPAPGTTREAEMLALELRRLLREGRKPGEIAVLVRSLKNTAAQLRVALTAAGIPFSIGYEEEMDHRPEVLLLHSLLRAGDNPYRDIDLVSAMYGPVFSFTLEELVRVREYAPRQAFFKAVQRCAAAGEETLSPKCRKVLDFLAECRRLDKILPPDRLLLRLFEQYGLLPLLSRADSAELQRTRKEALLQYYEFARGYAENGRGGISGLIASADRMMSQKVQRDGLGDPATVRIITIHKSKGLEFPVTILYGCGKDMKGGNSEPAFTYHPQYGACADLLDETGFGKISMPGSAARRIAEEEADADESIRLLYVGMTRAVEQLIITGSCPPGGPVNRKYAADLLRSVAEEEPVSFRLLRRRKKYLDWILLACMTPETKGLFELVMPGELRREAAAASEEAAVSAPEATAPAAPDEEAIAREAESISARLAYTYPAELAAKLPAKLSVTKLYPDLLDGLSGADLLRSDDFRTPRFVQENLTGKKAATAAERGTATHEFMQFCSFENCLRAGVEAEKERLIAERYLSPTEGERVEIEPVKAFFTSSLYEEMRQARQLWREKRFNVCLPASDFTKDPSKKEALAGGTLLVQGVIDCFFESADGKIVLLDYKTDRFTEKEKRNIPACENTLRERHGMQLAYYAFALRELLGREVDRVLIWSFGLNKAVEFTHLPDIKGEL